MLLLGVLIPSADAKPATCDEADSTCYTNEPSPATGEALLQHHAQREQSAPNSHLHKLFGSIIQVDEALTSSQDEDRLPAGAMEFFNAKLCKVQSGSASSHTTAASRTADKSDKSDKSAQSSGKNAQKSNSKIYLEKSTSKNQTGSGTKHASEKMDLTAGKSAGKSQLHSGVKDAHRGSQTVQLMSDKHTLSEGVHGEAEKPGKESTATNVALDESGMRKVAATKDDGEMKVFIRRVAASCNIKITNEGGLNGVVGWFNGKTADATFKELKEALFKALLAESKHHWADLKNGTDTTGENAPLDMIGYCQVRALRKSREMTKWVRRMVNNMGLKITDSSGFDGMMNFYSEPDDSGSFMKLMAQIKRAAFEHSWAELE